MARPLCLGNNIIKCLFDMIFGYYLRILVVVDLSSQLRDKILVEIMNIIFMFISKMKISMYFIIFAKIVVNNFNKDSPKVGPNTNDAKNSNDNGKPYCSNNERN